MSSGTTLTLGHVTGGFPGSHPFHLTADGILSLSTGSTLNVRFGSDLVASVLASDGGQVNVFGSGSSLNTVSTFINGGSLNVTAGGDVASIDGSISSADAAVDGNGSTWNVSQALRVGVRGLGTLNITGGGRVTTRQASLGSK